MAHSTACCVVPDWKVLTAPEICGTEISKNPILLPSVPMRLWIDVVVCFWNRGSQLPFTDIPLG
jgi:hypothetical protein